MVNTHPEYVHKFWDGILEADSPLLNSTRGVDLVGILDNRIILLDLARLVRLFSHRQGKFNSTVYLDYYF